MGEIFRINYPVMVESKTQARIVKHLAYKRVYVLLVNVKAMAFGYSNILICLLTTEH